VLAAVPEFLGRYLELVELGDDDPGAAEAFCELAEFVAELASGVERYRPVLTRCLAAVEEVASSSPAGRCSRGSGRGPSLFSRRSRTLGSLERSLDADDPVRPDGRTVRDAASYVDPVARLELDVVDIA
jgi:hypothetical protein